VEFKLTPVGALIYAAMAAWAAASLLYARGRRRAGEASFAAGFGLLGAGFVLRWLQAGHAPMQSMFEVFLSLGMCLYPLASVCHRVLGARGRWVSAALGVLVLFPAGFVFGAEPQMLPPALRSAYFVPHVAAYMLAYVMMIVAGTQAAMQLLSARSDPQAAMACELAAYRIVRLGTPLLTLGLALGAIWGKQAWGAFWHWDPKELWGLATWLIYVGYLHFRASCGTRHPGLNAALVLLGTLAVVLTLAWVNLAVRLFPGLHMYAF